MTVVNVVQHTSSDYLGLIEDHLEGRQIKFNYSRPFTEGGDTPHPDSIGDGLILLGGGPWGSAGTRNVPTLEKEITLVRTCLMLDKPIIGFGLGAQILAIGAGGKSIESAYEFEVGIVTRVKSRALAGYLPELYPHAVLMRDRPLPPDYAQILAVDEKGRPALFQIGTNAFGFSGHPGVKSAIAEDLIMEFEDVPKNAKNALSALKTYREKIEDSLVKIMAGLVKETGLMQIQTSN